MMKSPTTPLILLGLFGAGLSTQAAVVAINDLNVTDASVFVPASTGGSVSSFTPPAATNADPLDVAVTYGMIDLDGDGTANDSVSFTLRFAGGGASQRIFNQGVDTGFGSLNGVTVSMLNVTGTTTDLGDTIVFDGFTGANVGMGSGAANNQDVDINGTTVSLTTAGGGFQFNQDGLDFGPIASVLFDNSQGSGGSIVARSYDLQFSTTTTVEPPMPPMNQIPEPSRALLLSMAGVLVVFRRRR